MTIVCSAYSGRLKAYPTFEGDRSFESIDGIRYLWIRTHYFSSNSGTVRSYIEFGSKLKNLYSWIAGPVGVVVGQFGALSKVFGSEALMEAAEFLKDEKIAFVLSGTGPYKSELPVVGDRLNTVHLSGWVDKTFLGRVAGYVDLCFAGFLNCPSLSYGSDSAKVRDYDGAGEAIVHSHGDECSIVVRAKCGLRVEPANGRAVADAILQLRDMSEELREGLGAAGRKFVEKERSYGALNSRWGVYGQRLER